MKPFLFVAGLVVAAAAGQYFLRGRGGDRPRSYNDPTLARKVESEIFRPADSPKATVDVNVENGVVYLRGEVEDEDGIEALMAATRNVEGVGQVESLLHTPGSPARTKV